MSTRSFACTATASGLRRSCACSLSPRIATASPAISSRSIATASSLHAGSAADRWYLRQVGLFLARASWVWGAVMGGALVVRYLFDTLAPVTDYRMRATVLTYTIMAACLSPVRHGMAHTVDACGRAHVVHISRDGRPPQHCRCWRDARYRHDPATLEEWRRSGGLDETFIDVPLKVVAFGVAIGIVGAVLGKAAAKIRPTEMLTP